MGKQARARAAARQSASGKRRKIVVYTITKNEEAFIPRYCEAAKDADEIVIVDTGSTDRTVEVARECGATVHQILVSPWRFDVARNASMALLPADAEICIAADADEVLTPGWRQEIERAWTDQTTRLRYLYDWSKGYQFITDKIHARRGYLWKHPCHETLFIDGRLREVFADTPKLIIKHLPDDTKSRGSYFELLELAVKEDPHCVRHSFYFARELFFYGHHARAVEELTRYLTIPGSEWKDERAYAMRLAGTSCEALGKMEEGLEWFVKGTQEAPFRREAWYALAAAYYRRAMWPECAEAAQTAINTTGHRNAWPVEPEAWGPQLFDYRAISAFHLGDKKTALRNGAEAARMATDSERERFAANLKWYESMEEKGKLP